MVNARIRKAFSKNKTPIYSLGDPGDLTYEYKIIGKTTQDLKDIVEGKNPFNKQFLSSKKPIVIIGESALEMESGQFIFESIKEFLFKNNFINEKWNALNILTQNASTVGCLDLKFFSSKNINESDFFNKIKNNKFELIYLLGSDNLEVHKKDEFIIYQGSHGDRGAEIADVILPSPAYTEQNGLFINLEGRVQECRKASYPPGESMEDWKIFNLIYRNLKNEKLFYKYKDLRESTIKEIVNFSTIDLLPNKILKNNKKNNFNFNNEEIIINKIDYYFSNAIARSSKIISNCRKINSSLLKEGTNN